MVDKLLKIVDVVEKRHGQSVTLFALLKMDEYVDQWTIVFCAPWLTETNMSETFEEVRKEIIANLSPEEISQIARLAVYGREEHLIEELMKFKSGTIIENQRINGNIVHYANILRTSEL